MKMRRIGTKIVNVLLIMALAFFATDVYGRGGSRGSYAPKSSSSSYSPKSTPSPTRSAPASSSVWGSSEKSSPAKQSTPAPKHNDTVDTPAPTVNFAPSTKAPSSDDIAKAQAERSARLKSSSATAAALAGAVAVKGETTQQAAVTKHQSEKTPVYKTEQDSLSAMKNDPAIVSQYKTDFKEAPAVRPNYIPEYYTPTGSTNKVEVIHRSGVGYGYYNGPTWIAYDPFMNIAMYSILTRDHSNYAVNNDVPAKVNNVNVTHETTSTPVAKKTHSHFWAWFLVIIGIFVIAVIVTMIISSRKAKKDREDRRKMWQDQEKKPEEKVIAPMAPGFYGDKKDASFWKDVATKKKVIIKIADKQAYEDAMKAGHGTNLPDYIVDQAKVYAHTGLDANWMFFRMPGEQVIYLMVRTVNENADAYIMFKELEDGKPVIRSGNRKDLMTDGNNFLFCAPENENDFVPAELDWTAEFVMNNAEGSGTNAIFSKEEMGTQFTKAKVNPADSVLDGVLCGITEYHTDENLDNPWFIITEEGIDWNADKRTGKKKGGLCTIYAGCSIAMSDIEVSLA